MVTKINQYIKITIVQSLTNLKYFWISITIWTSQELVSKFLNF